MKTQINLKVNNLNFYSSQLRIGEMMISKDSHYFDHIIIRTGNGFISLTNPEDVWNKYANLKGIKLLSGESITLIQE